MFPWSSRRTNMSVGFDKYVVQTAQREKVTPEEILRRLEEESSSAAPSYPDTPCLDSAERQLDKAGALAPERKHHLQSCPLCQTIVENEEDAGDRADSDSAARDSAARDSAARDSAVRMEHIARELANSAAVNAHDEVAEARASARKPQADLLASLSAKPASTPLQYLTPPESAGASAGARRVHDWVPALMPIVVAFVGLVFIYERHRFDDYPAALAPTRDSAPTLAAAIEHAKKGTSVIVDGSAYLSEVKPPPSTPNAKLTWSLKGTVRDEEFNLPVDESSGFLLHGPKPGAGEPVRVLGRLRWNDDEQAAYVDLSNVGDSALGSYTVRITKGSKLVSTKAGLPNEGKIILNVKPE